MHEAGPAAYTAGVTLRAGGIRVATAIAVLLAVGLSAPTATTAASVVRSGGLSYVTKSYPPKTDAVRTLKAPCPTGTHVWAGGHYNDAGFSEALPRHSYPYDGRDRGASPDDGWKVQVSADAGVTVSVYATCADRRPRYEGKSVPAPGEFKTGDEVRCDKGFEAVAGGTKGYQHAIETAGSPGFGISWFFAVDNYGEDRFIQAFAVCLGRDVSAPGSNEEVLPLTQEGHSVSCPAGTRVVGGGVGVAAPFRDIAIAASRPFGFGNTGDDGGRSTWTTSTTPTRTRSPRLQRAWNRCGDIESQRIAGFVKEGDSMRAGVLVGS